MYIYIMITLVRKILTGDSDRVGGPENSAHRFSLIVGGKGIVLRGESWAQDALGHIQTTSWLFVIGR